MNIYLVSHPDPTWSQHTDFLIAADNEAEARHISYVSVENEYEDPTYVSWVSHSRIDTLKTRLLGTADDSVERGVIEHW